jgi:hypothetical protein
MVFTNALSSCIFVLTFRIFRASAKRLPASFLMAANFFANVSRGYSIPLPTTLQGNQDLLAKDQRA